METLLSANMAPEWAALCQNLNISREVTKDWWDIISRRYSEEWRSYHTFSHINHLLQLFSQWRERIAELDNLLMAIFFHDVVYNPEAKDNEWQSVILFRKFSKDGNLSECVIERVEEMIMATVTHSVNESDDLDLSLFLDFDMAILGQEESVYNDYAAQIRKEYSHFDDKAYTDGRTKVLQSILKAKHIYHSEDLRDVYETQARKNIENEIKMLSSFYENDK